MWKVSTAANRLIIKNGFVRMAVYYSKDSKEKAILKLYKQLFEDVLCKKNPFNEGGPNWELFNPKGNRFFLPNSTGLAWQNPKTVGENLDLEKLVDFKSQAPDKFHFSSQSCPLLMRAKVETLFPMADTMITLSYQQDTEVEYAARNFVLAATEICRRLQFDGYRSDFYNPFSGKPFFYGRRSRTDEEADHFVFKSEKIHNCMVMTSNVGQRFHGLIFTTAPYEGVQMRRRIQIELPLKMLLAARDDDSDDYDDFDEWDDK